MRSMGEGYALVILTFWRGDTLNVPLPRAGEALIQAVARHGCLAIPTGAIGRSLRCGDGKVGRRRQALTLFPPASTPLAGLHIGAE
jgi:hypothetical protein